MAKNAKSLISPILYERMAQMELMRLGVTLGRLTEWKPGRPIRKRGKRRNGQHRGHVNSRTSATSKHKR